VADLSPVAKVLARGPMPLSQSAKIVLRLCRLLEPIHAEGSRHGAVVPENVLFRHVGSDLTVELGDDALTPPQYVAPERVRGEAEGPGSDVYAMGVLFFHMISGFPPFDGDTSDEILGKHLDQSPPPLAASELQDIPIELERLIGSMLAKRAADRPSIGSVLERLENIDLDSTVMGERLQSIGALGAAPDDEVETRPPERKLLENVAVDQRKLAATGARIMASLDPRPGGPPVDPERLRTDPVIVDPYADTLIRNRVELGLERVDGDQDTALSVERQRVPVVLPKAGGQWSDDSTRILEESRALPAEAVAGGAARSSRLIFVVGAGFFIGALGMALWALLR
jgi:hypothetical protein